MKTLFAAGVLAIAFSGPALCTTIYLVSGSNVTFDLGPAATDFANIGAAQFTAAQTGTTAFVIPPNGAWDTAAMNATDPTAVWIGTNATAGTNSGNTALYAVSFTLPYAVSAASISIDYEVDNQLGSAANAGVYLNGNAFPTSTGGTFTSEFTYTDVNVTADLQQGTNWLYFDAVNTGGPAGLIFGATINTTDITPEPATFGLGGLGLVLIAAGWYRRRAAA